MRPVHKFFWPFLLGGILFLPTLAPVSPRTVVPASPLVAAADAKQPAPPAPPPAPQLSLPKQVTGKVGRYVPVKATTNVKSIQWFPLDDNLTVESEILLRDPNCVLVISDVEGTYRLECVGASGDTVVRAVTSVVIGTPAPPTPPVPPSPPTPTDPFTQGLQAAYQADTDPNKATHLAFLAAVYKGIAASVVGDKSLSTLGDLFTQLHGTIGAPGIGLLPTDLAGVRKYIGQDMNQVLGTTATTPLTDALRQTAATEFSKISTALSAVGGK